MLNIFILLGFTGLILEMLLHRITFWHLLILLAMLAFMLSGSWGLLLLANVCLVLSAVLRHQKPAD